MTITVGRGRAEATEVRALAARIEARDGSPPLSDQALGSLASDAPVHFVARADGALVGYAQLTGHDLELAAEPDALAPLLAAAEDVQPDLRVWTHGGRSSLAGVLDARGHRRERVLHQMLLPHLADVPAPEVPDGVTLRAFLPGSDEDAWLAVNAAAFVSHPEQGRWTPADLAAREAEEWFDPAGFLLAEHDHQLIGFHWTKIHPDGRGEVYVLGVSPASQGLGLGRTLLLAGLHHLKSRGCPAVLLYVDDDNQGAVHLYEKYGFDRIDADIQWRANSPG